MDGRFLAELSVTHKYNNWRYALYMWTKQVIWILTAKARVIVHKYNRYG